MVFTVSDFKPPLCEECGMGAVHHRLERFLLRMEGVMETLLWPVERMMQPLMPFTDRCINRVAPYAASLLFKIGLAEKAADLQSHPSETTQALWYEARRRGIDMYEVRLFGLSRRHFIARFGKTAVGFEGIPRPTRPQRSLSWIDDKAEVKKRFEKAGFPVARGGSAKSEAEALRLFRSLAKPVITKPQKGSGGRHTTVHIETEDELREAYRNARVISPTVMVEEELRGPVFRATLIDKKLVAVLRRDPPQVMGDGRATIAELVERENRNPLRRGPVFADIVLDSPAAVRELARQNLTPLSVPARGQTVFFHFKVNWGVGGTSRDATPEVHPENRKLFEDIGSYLGEDITGIDFIIPDIGVSWRSAPRAGVIECNSLPLIGNHHFPYAGPVVNVAGAVWDMVFPETQTPPSGGDKR